MVKTKWGCFLQYLIKHESCHNLETSQMICKANQLTGSYMKATLAFNELMRPLIQPFKRQPHKIVKYTRTIRRQQPIEA